MAPDAGWGKIHFNSFNPYNRDFYLYYTPYYLKNVSSLYLTLYFILTVKYQNNYYTYYFIRKYIVP